MSTGMNKLLSYYLGCSSESGDIITVNLSTEK
jgi:hypothetical protein